MQDGLNAWLMLAGALVAPLGADEFKTRERASKTLSIAAPALLFMHSCENQKSAEAAARQRIIFRRARVAYLDKLAAGILPRHYKKLPWVDGFNLCEIPGFTGDTPFAIWQPFLDRAEGERCGPEWPKYRNATKLLVRHLINYWSRERIQDLLDDMVKAEERWRLINSPR